MKKTILFILSILPLLLNAQSTEISLNLGHTDAINGLRFSADSKYLLSSSADGTLKLWEVESGKLLKTSKGTNQSFVGSLFLFSKQGLASFTPNIRHWYHWIWNIKTGDLEDGNHLLAKPESDEFIFLTPGTEDNVAQKPSPNDQLKKVIASDFTNGFGYNHTGFYTNEAYYYVRSGDELTFYSIWDKQIQQTTNYAGLTENFSFNSNGQYLFGSPVGATGQSFTIWSYSTGKVHKQINLPPNTYLNDISPDGEWLLVTDREGQSSKYDIAKQQLNPISKEVSPTNLPTLDGDPDQIVFNQVIVSPNGLYIARGGPTGKIYLHAFKTGTLKQQLKAYTQAVSRIQFRADTPLLDYQLKDGSWRSWDLSSGIVKQGEGQTKPSMKNERPDVIAWSGDQKMGIVRTLEEVLELWDMEANQQIKTLGPLHSILPEHHEFRSAVFSPDKKYVYFRTDLIARSDASREVLWNIEQNQKAKTFSFPIRSGKSFITFSPDAKQLLFGSKDGNIEVENVEEGIAAYMIEGVNAGPVYQIAFSSLDNNKFASHNSNPDGAVTLWDLKEKKELATVYNLNQEDWVIIGANGLFDASPGGMNLLFYKVEYEGETEIIELEQLKTRYYEPGLLQKLMGFVDEDPRSTENLSQVALYPKILSTRIENNQLNIQLKERNGGMGILSLFINGKEVKEDINPKRKTELNIDLKNFAKYYFPGKNNQLALRSFNREAWLKSRAIEIDYTPSFSSSRGTGSSSSSPNSSRSRRPHLYGLIVGTANYSGEDLDLAYSDKDAAAIYQALKSSGKALFGERIHIQLLSTDAAAGGKVASKANIKASLMSFAKEAKPEDILIVYFAGHGVTYGQAEKTQFYYLTKDIGSSDISDPVTRDNYTVSSAELTAWLTAIPAQKQVMMLDACNSGKVVENLFNVRALNSSQIRALDRMKDRTGMFVISGSAADKVSYEASQYGQGLLTYSLLQGMKLVSASNNDYIDVMQLFQYSRDRVPTLATGIGGIQTPLLAFPNDGSSFDIGIVNESVNIPVATVKPVFIRNVFQDENAFDDVLGIGQRMSDHFKKISSRGARASYIYVDVNQFDNAYSLKGRYTVNGEEVKVRGALFKDSKNLGSFEVTGNKGELNQLVKDIIFEVQGKVE